MFLGKILQKFAWMFELQTSCDDPIWLLRCPLYQWPIQLQSGTECLCWPAGRTSSYFMWSSLAIWLSALCSSDKSIKTEMYQQGLDPFTFCTLCCTVVFFLLANVSVAVKSLNSLFNRIHKQLQSLWKHLQYVQCLVSFIRRSTAGTRRLTLNFPCALRKTF